MPNNIFIYIFLLLLPFREQKPHPICEMKLFIQNIYAHIVHTLQNLIKLKITKQISLKNKDIMHNLKRY